MANPPNINENEATSLRESVPDTSTDQLDTGYPGFEIDGLVYHLSPGDADRESAVFNAIGKKGNINADQNQPPKDISKNTRVTLGNFLGKSTEKNYYGITGEGSNGETSKLASPEVSYSPGPQPTKNKEFFVEREKIGQSFSRELKGWQKNKTFVHPNLAETIPDFVKGKSYRHEDESSVSGNEILTKTERERVVLDENEQLAVYEKPVASNYAARILQNNRFSAFSGRNFEKQSRTKKIISKKNDVFVVKADINEEGFNPVLYHPKYGEVTTRQLAQTGTRLLDEMSGLGQKTGLSKIEQIKLEAKDVLEKLSTDEMEFISISPGVNSKFSSWGGYNNSLNKFDSLSSVSQALISFSQFSIIKSLSLALKDSLENFNPISDEERDRLMSGRQFGENSPKEILFRKQGLRPLNSYVSDPENFMKFVGIGISSFFIRSDRLEVNAIESLLSSGFVTSVSRTLIRNYYSSLSNISNLNISANLNSSIENNLNANFLSSFVSFSNDFTSRSFRILNVFSSIGEAVVKSRYFENSDFESEQNIKSISSRRLQDNSLAWSNKNSNNLLLKLTTSNSVQSAKISSNNDGFSVFYENESAPAGSNSNRFSEDERRKIEDSLEGEYVPFYFHDLRTNEIISFHAFLSSLSDNYSVSYDPVDGIGRVDSVQIYKKTSRTIDIGFHVVATNEKDFEVMWQKINKLLTLIYPQYSEGRKVLLNDGEKSYTITQPFSQVITSTPLIRIRLGDLLRSNYSKFALSRLFGLPASENETQPSEQINSLTAEQLIEAKKPRVGDKFTLRPGVIDEIYALESLNPANIVYEPVEVENINSVEIAKEIASIISKNKDLKKNKERLSFIENYSGLEFKITKLPEESVLRDVSTKDLSIAAGWGYRNPNEKIYFRAVPSSNVANLPESFKEIFVTPQEMIMASLTNDELIARSKKEQQDATLTSSASQDSSDFNSEVLSEKNAYVKSFNSVGGKGLAGVITNINFEWYDSLWETDANIGKAPMSCKVSLGFTPIHDISPGIDSNGFNRAPVYPVGRFKTLKRT